MKTGQYTVKTEDMPRLKELMCAAAAEVDACSEEDLADLEASMARTVQSLLSHKQVYAPVFKLKPKASRGSFYAGGLAFLAAALCFFMVRPAPVSVENNWQTKGVSAAGMQCDLRWVQADRSTPEVNDTGLAIQGAVGTHVEVTCPQAVFAHVALYQGDRWILVAKNQKLEEGRGWLVDSTTDQALNLSVYAHQKIAIIGTMQPLSESSLTGDAEAPLVTAAFSPAWYRTIEIQTIEQK